MIPANQVRKYIANAARKKKPRIEAEEEKVSGKVIVVQTRRKPPSRKLVPSPPIVADLPVCRHPGKTGDSAKPVPSEARSFVAASSSVSTHRALTLKQRCLRWNQAENEFSDKVASSIAASAKEQIADIVDKLVKEGIDEHLGIFQHVLHSEFGDGDDEKNSASKVYEGTSEGDTKPGSNSSSEEGDDDEQDQEV